MINIREFLGLSYYSSNLDRFLSEFKKLNPKVSTSQHKEIEKYTRIFALRDHAATSETKKTLWAKF